MKISSSRDLTITYPATGRSYAAEAGNQWMIYNTKSINIGQEPPGNKGKFGVKR